MRSYADDIKIISHYRWWSTKVVVPPRKNYRSSNRKFQSMLRSPSCLAISDMISRGSPSTNTSAKYTLKVFVGF